jgi:tRNA nucleotidyltransferase (CCA-adding enzyme)
MLNKIGEELFRDLLRVKWADALAQNPKYFKDTVKNLLEVDEKLNIIIKERECFSVKDLKINGEELIALGFNKGKEIGETLKYLLNEVIANPQLNEKSELIKLSEARLNENSIK